MYLDKLLNAQLPPIEKVQYRGYELHFLRLDKIHSIVSGNKFFKLKYNIEEALKLKKDIILTFGGAFSNHIAATANAAQSTKLKSIGIIRGEEVNNPTLDFAKSQGMLLKFVDRTSYRRRGEEEFLDSIKKEFGDFYLVPEGGTNDLAIRGTKEIHDYIPGSYTKISTCIGTGGTIAGLIEGTNPNQTILGFPALKGDWIEDEIKQWTKKENWQLVSDYHFGGYAKWKQELIDFINDFKLATDIPLDPIYTGKMVYGIVDMLDKKLIRTNDLLIIHSGGLQGIEGFNKRFGELIE